jgi:hypothetical protein
LHFRYFSGATDLDIPAYRQFQELCIVALNRSIAGLLASRLRMHVCWGPHKGPHNTDVPLRDIIDLMLSVQVEAYAQLKFQTMVEGACLASQRLWGR